MPDALSYFFMFAGQSLLGIAAVCAAVKLYLWSHNRRRLNRRRRLYDLRGRWILVTGASSGLGRALAREFYLAGAKVIVAARSLGQLEELCDELKEIGAEAAETLKYPLYEPSVSYLDLADSSSIASAVTDILKITDGHLDVLINNAGMSMRGTCEETTMAVHRQLMEVNYFGHVELTKLLMPALINAAASQDPEFPGPCIVGISSMQGLVSIPYRSAYGASKHAFQSYFDCLRAELSCRSANNKTNVRVLVVSPGYISTNLSVSALAGDGSRYGKMDEATKAGMTPEHAAKEIIRGIRECRQEMLLDSFGHKLGVIIRPLLPEWYFWWAARRARK